MADKKISALTGASVPLAGTEVLPIVQSGATVKVAVSDLTVGRAVSTGALTVVGTINGSNYQTLGTQASSGAGAAITLIPSSSLTNWLVGANYTLSGLFEITPSTAGGGSTFTTPVFTASSTGDIAVKTGNLVIGTSGKGIDFSANTGAAGMTSELLTWYEEGTWTVTGTNITIVGTPTYTGVYTRVGRQVTFSMRIQSTGSTSSVAGTSYINLGFPFVSSGKLFVASVINSSTIASIGDGLMALSGGNTIIYLPTWTTLADVTISGYYFV